MTVNISAKVEYACIAMLELARSYESPEPLPIRNIADPHGIPSRFLVQILLQLKSAGLVTSTRGAAGGYRLAQPPGNITLAAVMDVVDGHNRSPSSTATTSHLASALQDTWQEIEIAQQDMLESVTLADLVERSAHQSEPMYYI